MKTSSLIISGLLLAFTQFTSAQFDNFPDNTTEEEPTSNVTVGNARLASVSNPQCILPGAKNSAFWLSSTGPIQDTNCAEVLAYMINTVGNNADKPYLFYSKQVYPYGPPTTDESYGLVVGAQTSRCSPKPS